MTDPLPPEEIDFEANNMAYLRPVMGDDIQFAQQVYVSEGVWLYRLRAERNLWELIVDGEGVETLDADMVETSAKLGLWIRRRVELHRGNGRESEQVDEDPLPGGFQ